MSVKIDGAGAATGLSTAAEPVTVTPFTMACWFLQQSSDESGVLMSLNNSAFQEFTLNADGTEAAAGLGLNEFHCNDGGSDNFCQATSTYTEGVWQHAAAVSVSASSRGVLTNGANKGTNAVSTVPTITDFHIGSVRNLAVFKGLIEEAAVWNVALSDTEIADLAQGLCPLLMRPESLVFYLPMWNTLHLTDLIGSKIMSLGGAPTDGDHKPLFMPGVIPQPHVFEAAAAGASGRLTSILLGD